MNQKKSVSDIMKKFVVLSIMILSFSALLPMAFASKRCETYGPMTVHTGPWDLYDEICTLPSGVEIQAVEYEMNDQDGRLWHMIEFILGDKLYRGYVDEDAPLAFESASGYSEADHSGEKICRVAWDADVYAAPSFSAAVIGDVYADENVTVLAREGDYILVDYEQYGRPCRGYIMANNLQ